MKEFNKILSSNEKVIWEENPQVLPFIFYEFIYFFLGIVFSIFGGLMFYSFLIMKDSDSASNTESLSSAYILLLPLLFLLIPALYAVFYRFYLLLLHRNTWYVFTNLRVIIQKGLIGRDFETFDYDQIQDLQVNVSLIDKLFGKNSGTLSINIGKLVSGTRGRIYNDYIDLTGVTNPYSVFELLKKNSHNLKSDINYPNELREEKNFGYKTDIKS